MGNGCPWLPHTSRRLIGGWRGFWRWGFREKFGSRPTWHPPSVEDGGPSGGRWRALGAGAQGEGASSDLACLPCFAAPALVVLPRGAGRCAVTLGRQPTLFGKLQVAGFPAGRYPAGEPAVSFQTVLSRRLISSISPLTVASKARAFATGSGADSSLPGPVQY